MHPQCEILTFAINRMLIVEVTWPSYQTSRWRLDCRGFARNYTCKGVREARLDQWRSQIAMQVWERLQWFSQEFLKLSWSSEPSHLEARLYTPSLGRPLDMGFSREGHVNLDQGQFLERSWATHQCFQQAGNGDLNLKGKSRQHTTAPTIHLDLRRHGVKPND